MQQDHTLHLLILDQSLNDAETIVSLLRNSGYAVRATGAENAEAIEKALLEKPFELFLCADDFDGVSIEEAESILRKANKDVSLIALGGAFDAKKRIAAMQKGAREYVSKDDLEHLKFAIEREFNRMVQRRQFRKMETALKETEKRCHNLLASSRDPITYVADGMHIFANQSYIELFGYDDQDDIEGMPLLDMVESGDQAKIKEFLRSLTTETKSAAVDVIIAAATGTAQATLEFSAANYDGEPCHQIVIRSESADAAELETKLTDLRQKDLATGLLNRQHFFSVVDGILDNPHDSKLGSLLFISVDQYDKLKATIGIASFDLVLSELGKVVASVMPSESIVARYDDYSITTLHEKQTADATLELAKKIVEKVNNEVFDVQNQSISVTISIGACVIGDNTSDAQILVDQAQQARDAAVEQGGNIAQLSTPPKQVEEEGSAVDDDAIVQNIIDGLAKKRFYMVYLPIANLHGDGGEKYEAFVRLTDNDENLVDIPTLFQVAQRNQLGKDIDRWVIKEVISVLAARKNQQVETLGFINVTDETLHDQTFLPWLGQTLNESKLPADHLVFELNESSLASNVKAAKIFSEGLKQLHCSILIDQFGSGVNSFQLLKHVQADYLKFDRSLLVELSQNTENQKTLKEMVTTAHSMGKLCIAPNVEDAMSLAMLWQYEVNYIQGFFLHEPTVEMDYDFSEMIM